MTWPEKKQSSEYFKGSSDIRIDLLDLIRVVRQNHAMEHATITMLLDRLDRKIRLIGYTSSNGFYIVGDIPTDVLEQSAKDALLQLRGGESGLAVSPMCGTNLVVAGLVASIASMIAGKGHNGWSKFSRMATASTFAALAAQPLGRLAQKHITTDADQLNVTSIRVTKKGTGKLARHKVEILRS